MNKSNIFTNYEQGPSRWSILSMMLFIVFIGLHRSVAQTTLNTTTVTGWANNNGTGNVTFNFQNTNAYPIIITGIEGVSGTAGVTTAELWTKTTPISGSPGNISVANGWTQMATGTFTAVANTTTLVTQTMLSGLSVTIPAGVTYGMCVTAYSGTTTRQRYCTMPAGTLPTTTVSGGGCNIIMGTNISYGGGLPGATPVNTPRGWIGKLTFTPASPCIDPPTAGTVNATATNICLGGSSILSLVGGTGGTGQSYQWQSAATLGGPYTNIATSASITVTPTANTYYRCEVTCGANTSTSSDILITVPPPFPGGYYTIDNTLSTGGGNYASFSEAVSAISCGISGPVTFEVASGTGPYNEQVSIPQVGGTSATNTVTFLCNGTTLTYNATLSTAPHTLALNGSDYFRFNDLNVVGTGTTYALVGHLWNNADNNIFTNCTFTAPANGTSTTQVPFSCSGSDISATTTGLSGSNNELNNCTMTSGYYNTCFVGNSAGANTGNKVINCTIRDQYFYGSYNLYQNGMIISGNTLERPTRTTLSTYYGVYMSTGCTNILVEKNRIRNTWGAAPASTGTQYSIYQVAAATAGNENKIYNNLISDINFNGTLYGIYIPVNYAKVYHNTISFDQTTASGTTTTYGIYSTASAGVEVRNNNISITRGGTGAKYALYYTTAAGITSNNNNLYVNSTAGTNCVGFYVSGFPTLALWQGANASAWDQQSLDVNPNPENPSLYNYKPTNVSLDNYGINVGVTSDILGITRSTPPDIGCYEFTIPLIDMGVLGMPAPGTSGCYSSSENIEITIKNYGAIPIDFSLNPVTVNCDITGTIVTTLSASPSGILAPGTTMNVVLSPSINMTANGSYSFNPYTIVAGDANATNDALVTPLVRTVGPISGTLSSSIPSICVSGTPTLTLAGSYGGSLQWQESTVSSSGPWLNVGTGTATYTPSIPVTQTTYYQVVVTCNTNTAVSNTVTVTVNNPILLGTTPGSRCGLGTVNLSAQVPVGTTVNWYANASGGLPLATGTTSFTTPIINTTTNFYAAPSSGGVTANGAKLVPETGASSGIGTTNYGLVFDVLSPFTLNSVVIYPVSATSASGTIVIDVVNSAGVVLHTATFTNVPGSPGGLIPYTANVNFNLSPGTNLKMRPGTISGVTGLLFDPTAAAPGGSYPYPYAFPGLFSINTSTLTAPPTNTARNDLYYYFYNWSFSSGCEGPRTAVSATVNTAPSITATIVDPTLCPGGSTTISASSSNDPNYSYTWTSSIGGFTANGAGPHVITPTNITTYTVNAFDSTGGIYAGCTSQATVSVITAPTLSAGSISSSQNTFCISGTPTLTSSGTSGGAIQWQESTVSATGPWINVGTGASTYTPSSPLTQTTYFRVEVSCQSTAVQSNVITVNISNPTVLTTVAGLVCGTSGSATLSATSSAGSTPQWYAVPSGGTALGTGNTFTTPTISSPTNFYVSALEGTGGIATATMPAQSTTFATNVRGYWFTAPAAFTITAVNVPLTGTLQSIAIVKFNGNIPPPTFSTTTNAFTTLFLTQNNTNTGFISCNVPIAAGDVIGILGQRTTGTTHTTSYGPATNPTSVTIAGYAVPLTRMGMQFPLATTAPQQLWQEVSATSQIGRTEFQYTTGCEGPRTPVLADVQATPSITATPSAATICLGDSLTLSGGGAGVGGSYSWTGGVSDSSPFAPSTSATYTVTGTSVNGCSATATSNITVNICNTSLGLTCYIEGYWDGASAMLPVLSNQGQSNPTTDCDSITIELYNSTVTTPLPAPDYTTSAVLHTDGTATAVFSSAVSGNYYIVIKHRNALQTWSASALPFPATSSYNFSTAATQAYGSNQVEVATGVWAMYSGDVAIDENMDLLDLGLVETDISNFLFGYLATDLNGDGNVDLLDSPTLEANISNFVFASHP